MAIAKMNQFALLTFHTHKQELLKQLQVFGDVHLKAPDQQQLEKLDFMHSDFSQEQLSAYEVELEKVRFASGKLKPYVEKPKMTAKRATLSFAEFDRFAATYAYGSVYEKVKEQDEAIAQFRSEIARRTAENDTLAAWRRLDISPAQLEALTASGYLLGTVNKQVAEAFVAKMEELFNAVYIELLDTVKDDTTLLMLFPAEQTEEVYSAAREQGFTRLATQISGMPREVIEQNQNEIRVLSERVEAAAGAIKALAPEYGQLQIALDYFETVLERERARRDFLASETTLLIEGWVPADDSARLREIVKGVCGDEFYLEETPEKKDSAVVPIKLKNNRFVRAFESITGMYSMPRYNEIDPTPILAPFYWLFFGLMVGDIGYGLLLLVGTTVAGRIMDLKEGMRSFMKFFQYLSIAIIGAGVLYGSCFGLSVFTPIPDPAAETGFRAILDTQLSIVVMLVLSIVIGVAQILFGLAVKAYMGFRDRDVLAGFADGILFMVTLLSGIGWLLGGAGLVDGLMSPARIVFVICLVLIAATQGRQSPSAGGKIGNGLYAVYNLTGYVGDIVSYTRIVALALSGAYIAYAFNMMTGLVVGDFGSSPIVVGIIRVLLGAVIAVFGQLLNFGLSLLSAYVHTCRLQYVEYFGKFYEGGGVPFKPLSMKNENIHIVK